MDEAALEPFHRPLPDTGVVFVLLRHGESVANVHNVRQGQAQTHLSEAGLRQAREVARRWKARGWRFERVLSSPLQRAFHTALVFAHILGVPAVDVYEVLQERRIGPRHLLRPADLSLADPDGDSPTRFAAMGGLAGESPWGLYLRALEVRALMESARPGRYLLVAHGTLLNALTRALLGLPMRAHFAGPQVHFANLGCLVWHRPGPAAAWRWLAYERPEAL